MKSVLRAYRAHRREGNALVSIYPFGMKRNNSKEKGQNPAVPCSWLGPGLLRRAWHGCEQIRDQTVPAPERRNLSQPHHTAMVLSSRQLPQECLASAPNLQLRPVSARQEEEEQLLLLHARATQELLLLRPKCPHTPCNKGSHSLALKNNKK